MFSVRLGLLQLPSLSFHNVCLKEKLYFLNLNLEIHHCHLTSALALFFPLPHSRKGPLALIFKGRCTPESAENAAVLFLLIKWRWDDSFGPISLPFKTNQFSCPFYASFFAGLPCLPGRHTRISRICYWFWKWMMEEIQGLGFDCNGDKLWPKNCCERGMKQLLLRVPALTDEDISTTSSTQTLQGWIKHSIKDTISRNLQHKRYEASHALGKKWCSKKIVLSLTAAAAAFYFSFPCCLV